MFNNSVSTMSLERMGISWSSLAARLDKNELLLAFFLEEEEAGVLRKQGSSFLNIN